MILQSNQIQDPKHLKRLIDDRGMKQTFIANKLNVSNALVTQWLTGVKPIADRHIVELKRIFSPINIH